MLIVVLKNEKLKWFKIWNFRKIAKFTCREICAHENRDLNMSRKLHVTRYFKTSLNCQEKSNYSICPLNKVPEINCSWGYCSGHVVRKLKRKNKERKWCYLECGWIGFSALMISDVSFSVCGLQRGDRRLWRSETWERSGNEGFEKEKVAKIMFSFISWNLHEGWDEWFHYHSTHQQQETP